MYALSRIDSSTIARTMNAALVFLLASCAAPPIGPVPPSVELPQLAVGRSWTYQVRDGYNHGLIRTLRYTVASNSDDTVTLRVDDTQAGVATRATETARVEPLQIVTPRSLFVTSYTPSYPAYEFPLEVGRKWKRPYVITQQGGKPVNAQVYGRVAGWEHVIVPAGEFDALRIERDSYLDDEEFWRWGTRAYQTDWYAPAVGRFVRHEEKSAYYEKSGRWPDNERRGDWTVLELQSYEAGS
jgi:hypothetical protein